MVVYIVSKFILDTHTPMWFPDDVSMENIQLLYIDMVNRLIFNSYRKEWSVDDVEVMRSSV